MSDKMYKILKILAMIVLDALATFILLLGDTWGIPYAQQIATTLTGLGAFLGSVLVGSSKIYWEDKQIVEVADEKEN